MNVCTIETYRRSKNMVNYQ